jgi:hypothetical protein
MNMEPLAQAITLLSDEQELVTEEPCPPATGTCYRDALNAVMHRDDDEGLTLVHGKITTLAYGGKRRIDHAWIEDAEGNYQSPPQDHWLPKDDALYVYILQPEAEARYKPSEALGAALKTRHYGPWTEEELAKPDVEYDINECPECGGLGCENCDYEGVLD